MASDAAARGRSNRRRGREFQTEMRQYFEPRIRTFEIKAHALSGMKVDDLYLAVFGADGNWRADVSVECKRSKGLNLSEWWAQAVDQARQRGAYALVFAKRIGKADPADQWVITTVGELTALIEDLVGDAG